MSDELMKRTGATPKKPTGFVDPTDSIINSSEGGGKFLIRFFHLPTMKKASEEIRFKAFIEDFSDSYESSWNEESVYGRMDPIPIFQNTRRKITVSFNIPAASEYEAQKNLRNIDRFIQRLYPVYNRVSGMNVLSTAPLWRVKFANLISKSNSGLGTAKKTGLVCYITGFNFTPDLDPGMILSKTQLFPKNIKVNLTLNVLHEITPGFIDSDKFNGGALKHKFPYGVGNRSDVDDSVNKQARQQQAVDRASEIERIASEHL